MVLAISVTPWVVLPDSLIMYQFTSESRSVLWREGELWISSKIAIASGLLYFPRSKAAYVFRSEYPLFNNGFTKSQTFSLSARYIDIAARRLIGESPGAPAGRGYGGPLRSLAVLQYFTRQGGVPAERLNVSASGAPAPSRMRNEPVIRISLLARDVTQ